MNVFHYKVLTESSITDPLEEQDVFLDEWSSLAPGSFLAAWANCVPENYTLQQASAQFISVVRYRRTVQELAVIGTRDPAATSNVQASITYQGQLSGRRYIGGKRIPITSADYGNGVIAPTFKTVLQTFAARSLDNVVPATGGGIYQAALYHRGFAPLQDSTAISDAFVQDQVRVMRRRTVGLGI